MKKPENMDRRTRRYIEYLSKRYLMIGIVIGLIASIAFTVITVVVMNKRFDSAIMEKDAYYTHVLAERDEQYNELKVLKERQYNELYQQYVELQNSYEALTEEYHTVLDAAERRYSELLNKTNDDPYYTMELVQKYDYVVDYVKRESGFNLDILIYGDQLCQEYDINPHVLWAIVYVESKYNVNAQNPVSTARGLGQVLDTTAKSIYENYLGNGSGTYRHSMAYDPYINLDITTRYLKYLKDNYGSTWEIIARYSGDRSGMYYNEFAARMQKYGYDPSVINYT